MRLILDEHEYRISFRYLRPIAARLNRMSGMISRRTDAARLEMEQLADIHLRRASYSICDATVANIERRVPVTGTNGLISNHWESVSTGVAFCCTYDQYNAEFGRKLALRRALGQNRKFGATERMEFWNTYLGRKQNQNETLTTAIESVYTDVMIHVVEVLFGAMSEIPADVQLTPDDYRARILANLLPVKSLAKGVE